MIETTIFTEVAASKVARRLRSISAWSCAALVGALSIYACGDSANSPAGNGSQTGADQPGGSTASHASSGGSPEGSGATSSDGKGGAKATSTSGEDKGAGGSQEPATSGSDSSKGGSKADSSGEGAKGTGGAPGSSAGGSRNRGGDAPASSSGGRSGGSAGRATSLDGGRGEGGNATVGQAGGRADGGRSQAGGQSAPADGGSSSAPKSQGCGVDPPTDAGSIDVGGQTATYLLSVPKNYDKNTAYPIIFAFHGAGVEPSMFVTYFNLPTVAGAEAIVVTPQCLGAASMWSDSRDLPLFDALLARMQSQFCIDNTRIFAGGHSSGGMFTHTIGCKRGNVVRGIAALSAGPPSGTCVGEVAVWISQGTQDTAVKPEQGRAARDYWAKKNHCDTAQSTPVDPPPTVEYGGCDPGFAVRYCEYEGTHNLPSYAPKGLWDFFKSLK